jgi:hypothetical protein
MKTLAYMLIGNPKFNEKFNLVGFKNNRPYWYLMTLKKYHAELLKKSVQTCDFFIHQSISENHSGTQFSSEYLKEYSSGRNVWCFNYYFRGYTPDRISTYTLNTDNEKIDFNAVLFYLFSIGKSPKETKLWLETEDAPELTDFTLKVAKEDIAELKRRQTEQVNLGNEILGMSDVMDTWQENQLSLSLNHPMMHYYWILCRRILKLLEVEVVDDETWRWREKYFPKNADSFIFEFVRKTCTRISWPETMATFSNRGWSVRYIEQQFKKFEENTEDYIKAYHKHKIQKFLPL